MVSFWIYTAERWGLLRTQTGGENLHYTKPLRLHITVWLCSFRNFQLVVSSNTLFLPCTPIYWWVSKERTFQPKSWKCLDELEEVTRVSPLLHAQTETKRSIIFHRRFGIIRQDRDSRRQRETPPFTIGNSGTCVSSYPQAGTTILLLKTPTSPLEAQAPNIPEMHLLRLRSLVLRQGSFQHAALPPPRASSHLSELGFCLAHSSQAPGTTRRVRGTRFAAQNPSGRDTHHKSTFSQHEASILVLEKIPQLGSPDYKTMR